MRHLSGGPAANLAFEGIDKLILIDVPMALRLGRSSPRQTGFTSATAGLNLANCINHGVKGQQG